MRFKQSLMACIAALLMHAKSTRASHLLARAAESARHFRASSTLIRVGLMAAALVIVTAHYAAAQEAQSAADAGGAAADVSGRTDAIFIPNEDLITGFETPRYWAATVDKSTAYASLVPTTLRTQGSAALSLVDPPSDIWLVSYPLMSTAHALADITKQGALLQLDMRVQPAPTRAGSLLEQLDADSVAATTSPNASSIQAFVTSKSRGLNQVSLGTVSFQKLRSGIYNTIAFSIPDSVRSALNGSKFTDLVFWFQIKAASPINGAYLFDNLRVHSVAMVQSPENVAPPAGYGGALTLQTQGSKAFSRTFTLAPTQIPAGFQLKAGTTGTTTVQLELGLEASPQLSCLYAPQSTASTNMTYTWKSCSGGYRAGDLVKSNWVSLGIVGGISSQVLQAQLALSPLGDLSGSGLIPAMPTYWGEAHGCTPAPVHGKVVTISTSCANQRAKANQILTNYFNAVKGTHPTANWIVAPLTAAATRSGNGAPPKPAALQPLDASNNVPFNTGGDLNPGGTFDAYWQLSGNLNPTAVAGTDENLTHFDAAFTAHGVLFGDDVDMVDAKVTADTDSGETVPAYKPATSSGTLGFYVFGEEIPSGGLSFNPSTGFSVDPSWTQAYDLPPIQIWIFDITLGALVDADLKVSGSAALSGADLSVVPSASLGGHIKGGISLGIAEGSVDAKVNLVTVSTPMEAQAKWVIDNRPAVCAATLNGALKGDLDISSGGGEVDLDATFGVCPFCYTDSYTLVKWGALASKSWNLFSDTIDTKLFGLPGALCKYPITVKILSPTSGATLSSGLPVTLAGLGAPNDPNLAYTTTYNWTYSKGAHAGTITIDPGSAHSANPTVTFGPPTSGTTSTWTIGMTATTTVSSASGTILTQTASAAPVTVTVTSIQPGVHIGQVVSSTNGIAIPDPSTGALQVGNFPGTVSINGVVVGGTGALNTVFTAVFCNDGTPACSSPSAPFALAVSGAGTAAPVAAYDGFVEGYYVVTMTTMSGTTTIGSTTVVIFGTAIG